MHIKHMHEMIEKIAEGACEEVSKGIECVDTEEMGEVTDMLKDLCEAEYYAHIVKAMKKAEEDEEAEEKYLLRMFKEENKDEYKRMREQYGEEDGERRFYDSWRYSDGRFAPKGSGSYRPRSSGRNRRSYTDMMPMYHMTPEMYREHDPEYYRDMDRDEGRMYYNSGTYSSNSGGNMSGMSGNRSGNSGNSDGRRNYDGENRNESRFDRARKGYEEAKENHKNDKQMTMKETEKFIDVALDEVMDSIDDSSPEVKSMVKSKVMSRLQKL